MYQLRAQNTRYRNKSSGFHHIWQKTGNKCSHNPYLNWALTAAPALNLSQVI